MRLRLPVLIAVFSLLSTSCVSQTPSQEALIAKAKEMDDELDESYNKRDLDGFLKNYINSDDLVLVDQERILKGFASWKTEIENQFKEIGDKKTTFNLVEKSYLVKGDHVYGWGKYKVVVPIENSQPRISYGIFTSVKVWQGGRLLTIMETYTRVKQP